LFQCIFFPSLRAPPARLYRFHCDILDRVYSRCRSQDHRNSCWHACRPGNRVSTRQHSPSHSSELSHPSPFFPFPENSHSSSCFIVIGAATLADIYEPAERGKMVGIFYAAPLLGPSLGPLLGGVLAQAFSWRATMWLLAAILGIDLVLFTFFFRDTFRRERSLTYRCAVARRQSTIMSRAVRARDTISSREKASLGDGPTSRSSSCGTAAGLDAQAKITLSLADVNPFPPLLPVLRRRNNVTTLFSSGSTPPLPSRPWYTHSHFRFSLCIWLLHRIHVLSNTHQRV
jgi:Major Facilitator Superfamily